MMIRLSVAMITFGMVEDVSLETESCQSWICQRNNAFDFSCTNPVILVIYQIHNQDDI